MAVSIALCNDIEAITGQLKGFSDVYRSGRHLTKPGFSKIL